MGEFEGLVRKRKKKTHSVHSGTHRCSTAVLREYSSDLPRTNKWIETVEAISRLEKPGDLSRLWRCALWLSLVEVSPNLTKRIS